MHGDEWNNTTPAWTNVVRWPDRSNSLCDTPEISNGTSRENSSAHPVCGGRCSNCHLHREDLARKYVRFVLVVRAVFLCFCWVLCPRHLEASAVAIRTWRKRIVKSVIRTPALWCLCVVKSVFCAVPSCHLHCDKWKRLLITQPCFGVTGISLVLLAYPIHMSPVCAQDPLSAPPQFVVQPSQSGGVVSEGQLKILHCEAVGLPPPQYQWLKDGQPIGEFTYDPMLRLTNLSRTDSGIYQCVAKNAAGAIFSDRTGVTVAYMTSAPPPENSVSVTVQAGHAAIFDPPPVESVPAPTVSWQRVGQGNLYGMQYAAAADNRVVILAASAINIGQYQAVLTNTQVGQVVKGPPIQLTVSDINTTREIPPTIVIPPRDVAFEEGTYPAILECIANARPLENLETVWIKDGAYLPVAGLSYFLSPWNRSLTLLNVGPGHEGKYECEARLRMGAHPPAHAEANVTVYVKPTIKSPLGPETTLEIGQPVLLPCMAEGKPQPNITWYRNTIHIDESVRRYQIMDNGSLAISSLMLSDSGVFQCVVQNTAGQTSVSTRLHVKISPPVFLQPPSNVTVLDGRDVQIPCDAAGSPVPNTTWTFNDGPPLSSSGRVQILDTGTLLIASLEKGDIGKYTCKRANSAGAVTDSAYLMVLVRTQIIQPPADTKVILSSTAELQCKVSHDPSVEYHIRWYIGEIPIEPQPGGRIQILTDGTLRIEQARNTDVATYTCKVTSSGGNETRSAKLNVIELPYPPTSVKAVLLNTVPKGVNISWSKAFDGNSAITSYIIQMSSVPIAAAVPQVESLVPWQTARANISGEHRYHILSNLKPASVYQFRVSAVNGVGEGNPSPATETITLPPEPPSGPPQGVVGGARSSTSIMIQWQPPEEEARNGDLFGYMVRYKLAGYAASPWAFHNVTNEAQHSFLLQDLIVWQNYEIQVAAYNEKGVGVYSDGIYIRTREGVPQSAPSNVRAVALNSTAVQVWWFPPDPQLINGINQGYKLEAWSGPLGNLSNLYRVLTVPPSPVDPLAEQVALVTGLKKYTKYDITVLCFTSPGDGPKSQPVSVTTKQDIPDEVSSLKFEEILDRSVRVVWSPPDHVNGILLGYTLKYHVKDVPEKTVLRNLTAEETEVLADGLRPTTAYTFEIYAWTAVGPGLARTATIQSGIPPVLPGPPYRLAVSNIGAFSVVLQFTPGFDGNSSIIKWSVEGQTRRNDTWTEIYEVSDPDASTITVHNLIPFTEYRLRLLSTNVVGTSQPSEPTKYFQTIQAPPSHAPYNVTVRAVNAKALRVRWTPLQQAEWYGIPRGYNISYHSKQDGEAPPRFVLLEDYNANSYVLEDLEEYTEYGIHMQAFNDVGTSPPSAIAHERTRESVPSVGPLGIEANATSSTTVVVRWGEVPKIHQNGIIEGYKVYYGAKTVPFQYKKIEGNGTFITTLTELKKFTLYSVQVLAFTRVGDGALGVPPVSVRTFEDVPGLPSNISFPDVSTTTARIIWDIPEEPNGEIMAYRVSYQENGSMDGSTTKELAPTERTLKAFSLNPESYYIFSVTAKTAEGWGRTASALVYTTNNREAPQPPSPPHISKSQVQSRQITFSWTPGRDGYAPLRYYTVQVSESSGPWFTLPTKVDPTVTTYTTTGLRPFTAYRFRIQAINDIGASGWSPESNLTHTLPAAPSDAPRSVVVTPYTTTSVRITWSPLYIDAWNGDAHSPGYRVEYCLVSIYAVLQNNDCPSERVPGSNASSVSLENLEQDRIYEVKVFAYNSRGDGPPSQPVTVYVGEAVPTGEPRNVQAEALSSTEIRVTWKPPLETQQNGDLLGYKIFYLAEGCSEEEMEAVPVTTVDFVLIALHKYTPYKIQILAFNPAGDGPRSQSLQTSTKEDLPGPPSNLIFSDITMTSVNVSWTEPESPNGKIRAYLVAYETAMPDVDFSKQVWQKVINTYLPVHGLREIVMYTFHVSAETFGYGPELVGNLTTGPQEGSPGSVQELVMRHTHTSVTFNWRNGPPGSAPIVGYLIEAHVIDDDGEWQTVARLNNGPQVSYTISYQNLLPSTQYDFRIFARNRYGISFPSNAPEVVATPSKLYLEYRQKLPFYREVWFLVMLAAVSVVIIILIVAVLCVKSKAYKYKKEAQKTVQDDRISMDDGGFATFELRQSRRGTLCKNSLSRKTNSTILAKSPPRPSPASVTYSDDEDVKGYDENCDSSSLTEKPSEISSSDSQNTESDGESDTKSEPHSFVNHYANVNDTLRQSWKRQRPVKPPSYTDSEPEGSVAVSLNGGHIIMNNMAGSRAPLPGFSSFV